MANVAGNSISGNITGVVNNGTTTSIITDQNFSEVAPINGDNRFGGGQLTNAGNAFTVAANLHGNNFLRNKMPKPKV